MRFIIFGAGALGSILALHLLRAGHEVSVIARGQRAIELQDKGIRLRGLVESQQACRVITDTSKLESADVLIISCKTYHHQLALEQLKHIRAQSVFSVANGVLKTEQIKTTFGAHHTLGCMADLSGELLESGEVLFTRNINLQIGAFDPAYCGHANDIASAINDAGINSIAVTNIKNIEWSKFTSWLAFLALSVITRLESYKFLIDPGAAMVMHKIIREMHKLAIVYKIELIDQSPAPALRIANASTKEAIEIIHGLGLAMKEKAPNHRMSALQDLENGRQLEVEETMGDALAKARLAEIKMPTIETCYQLLSTINRDISGKTGWIS